MLEVTTDPRARAAIRMGKTERSRVVFDLWTRLFGTR